METFKEKTPVGENEIKRPQTDYDLHPLIQKRWSPRSFSERIITQEQLNELFEAARWAASAFNEQPWYYVFARRGTPGFESLWSCLSTGNQAWAKSAGALVVALQRNTFTKNGKTNPWASHDLGMANAQLLMQAAHRDIYGHLMAGFDQEKITTLLSLENEVRPVCLMALGYLGQPDELDEPYKTKELTPRSHLSIHNFTKEI